MRICTIAAGLFLASVTTLSAEVRYYGPGEVYRDSDGDVISVLYGMPGVYWKGGVVYFTTVDLGGVPTSVPVEFTPVTTTGALPDVVQVENTTFDVERTGGQVFLRNTVSGERFAAARRVSDGTVSPKRYGLD